MKYVYFGTILMPSINISAKIYENKRVDRGLPPLDVLNLCDEAVCVDYYLKNWNQAKFLMDCSSFLEEDAYIQVCDNDIVVFDWLVTWYKPSTKFRDKVEVTIDSVRGWLETKPRKTTQDLNFVNTPFGDAIQQLFDSISAGQWLERRCVDSPNDFNVTLEIRCWTNVVKAIEDILWDSEYQRGMERGQDINTWEDCCIIRVAECMGTDRTQWTEYEEVTYDNKATSWNTINDIELVWKAKRKNQVIATADIWWNEQKIVVDDWAWYIVWTDEYETEATSIADLTAQAEARLEEVNVNKRVYKIWVEINAIDADIWDKIRLLITGTKFDFDWPVTVLRKTVCYVWWIRQETVYIWDPSVDIPTRRQVIDKLLDV